MPILTKFNESYKLWHGFLIHLPKLTKHTLGTKIDNLFTDIIELTLTASYIQRTEKIIFLEKISKKLDTLKYFITILWEIKGLNTNKYSQLSGQLITAGKMMGGWIKEMKK
ncbi:MAG: four helix bundle protein [Candidatus Magasanikbacteria bacterium]